jgi:hypothetical protein
MTIQAGIILLHAGENYAQEPDSVDEDYHVKIGI